MPAEIATAALHATQGDAPHVSRRFMMVAAVDLTLWWAGFASRESRMKEPLRVAVGLWPGAETFILAREAGVLPVADFRLMEVPWPGASVRALASRTVDAAVISLVELIFLLERGNDLVVLEALDISRGADVLLARPSLRSTADLKGCRVGVESRTTGIYLLTKALAESGLSLADVESIPLNAAELADAYAKQDIDAAAAPEPWASHIRRQGAVGLFDSSRLGRELVRLLVCRREALAARGPELARLVSAHRQMQPFLVDGGEHPGLDAVLRREGLDVEESHAAIARMELLGPQSAGRMLVGAVPELQSITKGVVSFMRTSGLLQGTVTLRNWMAGGVS